MQQLPLVRLDLDLPMETLQVQNEIKISDFKYQFDCADVNCSLAEEFGAFEYCKRSLIVKLAIKAAVTCTAVVMLLPPSSVPSFQKPHESSWKCRDLNCH